MAWLSLAGLYSFNESLFDGLQLPDGLDRDVVIFNLLSETAELEIVYPSFDFMKKAIEMWSKKDVANWRKMYNTEKLEYNPIENYDRIEEWSDKNGGEAVSSVAAFNANQLVPSGSGETKTHSTHSGHTHGNIGVTTTQQMIEQERECAKFNTIDYIVQSFKKRFCIMVY